MSTLREEKFCNCADCGKVLRSVWVNGVRFETQIAAWITTGERRAPHCAACMDVRKELAASNERSVA